MNDSNYELFGKTFIFSIILFIGIFLAQLFAMFLMEYISPEEIENTRTNLNLIHLVFLTWFNFVFLIILYLFFTFLEKKTLKDFRLYFSFPALFQFVIAICVAIIISAIYIGILRSVIEINIIFQKPENVYLILLFAFFTAFSEELAIRGYLLGIFISKNKNKIGILISAIVFAMLHIFNPMMTTLTFINIFLSGIFLAIMTIWFRNIYFAIGFHLAFNFLDIFLDFNPILSENKHSLWKLEILSKNELFTGGINGLTGSFVLTLSLLSLIALACIGYKKCN